MSQILVQAAASSIKPAHATYYGKIDEKNPVILAAEQELKEVVEYFTKKSSGNHQSAKSSSDVPSRGGTLLFNIWNKYEPRWPTKIFHQRMVKMGDKLLSLNAIEVALRQCYRRFLLTQYKVDPYHIDHNIENYRKTFFPKDQPNEDAVLTARAMIGMSLCKYKLLKKDDPYLENDSSLELCLKILHGIRAFMQCLMVHEKFCWLQYNSTIVIYQICRDLMSSGHSIKVVEYLLWASVTMESSIPLLCIKYLEWRTCLYAAVCHAYYDCNASKHAEDFASRALSKINELSELEKMSSEPNNPHHQLIYRKVTHVMASLVFKRLVFESRRKPKGLLRPKVKTNLKDVSTKRKASGKNRGKDTSYSGKNASWPRTETEKYLYGMFQGSSAQFLAILEALTQAHKRIFHTGEFDTEHEINEVVGELFFAAKEIIAGGGGNTSSMASSADHSTLAGVRNDKSMKELAANGECGVTLNAVVRLTKLAFSYEQWTTYNNLLDCTLIYIKKNQDAESDEVQAEYGKYEFCLALLLTVERVIRVQHPPPPPSTTGTKKSNSDKSKAAGHDYHHAEGNSHRNSITGEDLVNLAETVYYCIYEDQTIFLPQGPDQEIVIDRDMILDVTMILWSKCKAIFSKYQIGSIKNDNSPAMMKTGNMGKWLHVLTIVHLSMTYLQVAVYDPALITEVALRLSFALETVSKFNLAGGEDQGHALRPTFSSIGVNPVTQLSNALYVIKSTYTAINERTPSFTTDDVTRVADVGWVPQDKKKEKFEIPIAESLISELQVELMVTYHRVTLKLIEMKENIDNIKHISQEPNGYELPAAYIAIYKFKRDKVSAKSLKEFVGCSPLCNALLYMQKATKIHPTNPTESRKLLNKSLKEIETCQEDELRLLNDSQTRLKDNSAINGDVPSAPVLLARSSTCMVFKPPVFQPSDKKVAWWKIFGRNSSGHNVKVRFNDSYIQGTGEEVPDDENAVFQISGLKPNQKYIFAVAAYTASGSVIGGTIGKSSMEIISSYPMSILSVYSHLAQASYITNASKLCRKACSVLWEHFVTTSSQFTDDDGDDDVTAARKDYQLKNHRLDHDKLMHASPLLLRHAMTSIQIGVDSVVREKKLFCDRFSEEGILMTSQMLRIHECEKMLIGIEIAGWLGDSTSYLQCIVQTYGLITPLIQANINSNPFMQVALKCCHGLKNVSPILRVKRSAWLTESLNHMVACLANYVVKVAKSCGQISLAFWAIQLGKDLINPPPVKGSKQDKAATRRKRSIVQSHELMMLERKFCELREAPSTALELTGNEEPPVVFTRLFELKTTIAFCELTKFRKRTKYMEFFVYVLKRALRNGNIEVGITWCRDMLMSLHKRAEVMNVYKPLPSKKQNGSIAQGHNNKEDASDSKRFAAAVVEFTKASQIRRGSKKDASGSNKETKGSGTDKGNSVGKRYVPFWRRKGSPPIGLNITPEQEEEERKAILRLSMYFIPAMRAWQKRRKLRKLTTEEMPWRSEFNHLVALMHLHMYFERLHERRRQLGIRENHFQTVEFLDNETWSLTKCKALVVDWTDPDVIRGDHSRSHQADQSISRRQSCENIQMVTNEELPIEIAARTVINSFVSQKITEAQSEMMMAPMPACGKAEPAPAQDAGLSADITTSALIELFRISMLSFKRSLVLAHRGRHWTLLQNISRDLHSCVKKALHLSRDGDDVKGVTKNQIKSIACKCMSTCADLLIDMLQCCDKNDEDDENDNEKIEINEEMGGAPFNFDKYSDDIHFIDKKFIIRAVLSAVQLLYIETRWEELIDICLRFSALTHQRFAETISPILAHAQLKLSERIEHFGGEESPQTHLMSAAARLGKKFPANKDYTRMQLMVRRCDKNNKQANRLKISTFPDGGSGDVYGFGKEALALSSVPFDPKHTMGELNQVMENSKYASRSLQHSRRLLAIYLASLQRSKEFEFIRKDKEVQINDIETMVGKGKSPAQNICPPIVKKMSYKKVEVSLREAGMKKCSTVIDSYSRTIELLKTDGRWDLTSQAASELGDIYYHSGNVKTAQNCWNFSLDKALKMKNAARKWEDLLNEKDESKMVADCGVWGCLHAITVAGKLGQYCADNIASKANYILLAAQVVKRLFQSTLPHPTTECDYATYELIPTSCEENLEILTTPSDDRVIPPLPRHRGYKIMDGINIFADEDRCNLSSIMASLHWICEEMYQLKYYVQMLPLFTLYQYIATFLARDMVRSVMCRTMKLKVLTKLHKFQASSHEAIHLLYGACLPHPTDAGYAPMDNYPLISELDCSKPLMHNDNLHIMEVLAGKRISKPLAAKYGPQLTCDVTIAVASLLSTLSNVIPVMPLRPSAQDYQLPVLKGRKSATKSKSPTHGSRTNSQMSLDEGGQRVDFIFTMRATPLTPQLFRGMLLYVAENLLTTVLRQLESGITSLMTSPELWLVVESRLLLADINRQFQLPSIGTLHSLAALNYLQNSSLFSDDDDAIGSQPSPYTMMEELYRMRLTASLWLRCRHSLCLSASLQIKGLSKVSKEDGVDSQVEAYCADGLYEADSCKDHEMQAIFLLLGASLDGVTSEESYYMLEDAINSLNEVKHLSYQGQIALAEANIKLTDIGTMIGKITDHQEIIDSYSNARSLLLMKSMEEGEVIEHDRNINYSSIRLPLQNPHLSHLILLLHIHLRHASSLFKKAVDDKQEVEKIVRLLEDAEKLSILSNQHLLLIEIRYQLCKARRLLLSHDGHLQLIHSQTSGTLSRVQSSMNFSFEFLRLICLELALIEIGIVNKQFTADYAPTDNYSPHHSLDSEHDEVEPPITSMKVLLSSTASKKRATNLIYAAFHYQNMERERAALPGNTNIIDVSFKHDDVIDSPHFLIADMMSPGEMVQEGVKRKEAHQRALQQIREDSEQMYNDVSADDTPSVLVTPSSGQNKKLSTTSTLDSMTDDFATELAVDSLLTKMRLKRPVQLTWSHVLYYNLILQRKSKLTPNISQSSHEECVQGSASTDDEGAVSLSLRTPLNSEDISLRLNRMSEFLHANLPLYQKTCTFATHPKSTAFICIQYYRDGIVKEDGKAQVKLIWTCVLSKGSMLDCEVRSVSGDALMKLTRDLTKLKQKTEEYFSRMEMLKTRQKSKGTETPKIDDDLNNKWLEIITQITALLSDTPVKNLQAVPFDVTVKTASLLSTLPTIGGYFDHRNPLYKWLSSVLRTHLKEAPQKKVKN